MDITETIKVKSDQLNADDLLAGPITVTVEGAKRGSEDQPVIVNISGGHQPWKPCKGMRRVLLQFWGKETDNWIGKSITLFRDPTARWSGKEVGGIRISHMEGLQKAETVPITVSRGKKEPVTIQPLNVAPPSFMDAWRAKFKAAPKAVRDVCRRMAAAYEAGSIDALEGAVVKPEENVPDDWRRVLGEFADAIATEVRK